MAETDTQKKPDPADGINSDFIIRCLKQNELGDANLFKKLYRDRFVFNKAADSWMIWNGHHWEFDKMGYSLIAVDGVAQQYEQEAIRMSGEIREMAAVEGNEGVTKKMQTTRKDLTQRTTALRSTARRYNCLGFAHTSIDPMAIVGDEIDQRPWMLPCANGVVNLQTGELHEGRHRDFLLKASPVEWKGYDTPAPIWEQTLLEIFSGRQEVVDCFQRVCGYAMVGKVIQNLLIVMTGKGRNGKSMLVTTISKVLGPLAGAIRSEMLLDQFRVANSAGPSPDIMGLRGLRMAFASETDDGCKISPSKVKWLTGNDIIVGRSPHDKYDVQFKPSHTLFLLTNHKPHAPAEDYAFWKRVVLFPFELSFVDQSPKADDERLADPHLSEKLEKELSGILAWMVRGCLAWQEMGVAAPKHLLSAVEGYQREEDSLA
ncbi:MAG: DNA primase, partial [Desulfamplus sp.]|nr:DNA primase [Desulfamplus sp.]